jgi:hypothetical protein
MTLGLLVAFLVATCGSPVGHELRTNLPTGDYSPLQVVLSDATGLVTGIEPAEADPQADAKAVIEVDPADPAAFIVTWLGGLCESEAVLTFRSSESSYFLHVEVHRGGGGCPAMAVSRSLRVRTSNPIPAESIVVTGGG